MLRICAKIINRLSFSKKGRGNSKGFTLIEIMISLAVGVSLGAVTLGLFFQSFEMRRRANDIMRASFVAENIMDVVKAKYRPETGEGALPGFEKYKYRFEIEEIEVDLIKKAQEIMGTGFSSEETSKALDNMPGTGLIFKMLRYEVTVTYDNEKYQLEFYRGQGVF